MSRLALAALAIVLVAGGGTLALAVSSSAGNGSNAAISQYETVQPSQGGGDQGIKGVHGAGGKGKPGRGNKGSAALGGSGSSKPVKTAFIGPASAATGLPFTGFNALALAILGMLLVLAGVAQRRFETKRQR